ncbi:unnamed protein product [Lasius platythorax]|uniref:MADF domain-containing protein n=1 Tax=Lasius platythorax TaxID=488582 RepID=A0AAV2MYB4_9HYME
MSSLDSQDEQDPKVGWIYKLGKVEVSRHLREYGKTINESESVKDLRRKLAKLYKSKIATAVPGNSSVTPVTEELSVKTHIATSEVTVQSTRCNVNKTQSDSIE